ncbi:MAG: hypothetical protein ABI667_01085 [Sphingomicrobium sp.]
MSKRPPIHSDNDLIDNAGDLPTPSQGSGSGGNVATRVGTRAKLHAVMGGEPTVERVKGHDDPVADAVKGPKTQAQYPEDE